MIFIGSTARSTLALLLAVTGGALLITCDDLTLHAPSLLLVWASMVVSGRMGVTASVRRLLPIALSAFGVALLATLAGTSSTLGIRYALGTANVAFIDPLPLRLAVILLLVGPISAMLPVSLGGMMPVDSKGRMVDQAHTAMLWWGGCGALLRILFGLLPPLMQGLRLEVLLPVAGGLVAFAGGVLALSAQRADRLLSALLLLRIGVVLGAGSAFEGDVLGAITTSVLLDGLALVVALLALRWLSTEAGDLWLEMWEGRGLIDRGPALALVLAVAVLAGVPGTVQGLTLMMQSRAVVAAGEIAGPLLLAIASTLGVIALLRLVRLLYLRPPQIAHQHATRRWLPRYLLLALGLAALTLPPVASLSYRAGRRIVAIIIEGVNPQKPSSSNTQ